VDIDANEISQAVLKRLDQAYNTGDASAYAAEFSEDADFVNRFGMHLVGRKEIEERHRVLFTRLAQGTTGELELVRARAITDSTIVARANADWQVAGGAMAGIVRSRYTLVLVNDEGVWRITAMQNTGVSDSP
jgi:uncharacterized protein (TIGR02246 family)